MMIKITNIVQQFNSDTQELGGTQVSFTETIEGTGILYNATIVLTTEEYGATKNSIEKLRVTCKEKFVKSI